MLASTIALMLTAGAIQADFAASDIRIVDHPPCKLIDTHNTRDVAHRAALQEASRLACRVGPPVTSQEATALLSSERFAFRVDLEAGGDLVAGRYETGFLASARRVESALSALGYEVRLTEFSAGHTMEIPQSTLAPTLDALFPGPAARGPAD